jgi:predicted dithiol-disulfide oxidoreductase (DUF899 family)
MAAKKSAKSLKRAPKRAMKSAAKARPKAAAKAPHDVRFPGEGAAYRRARNALLEAEASLRQQIETVAALRRRLPPGGVVSEDYVFSEGPPDLSDMSASHRVKLSELFEKDASLVIYSFMYGPAMAAPCPSCTAMLDSLNGAAPHVMQRVNLAIVAKSPLQRIREFARSRGWRHLRLLSSAENSYNRDYHGETEDGAQIPNLNVFRRRNGGIHHVFATELLFAPAAKGMDHRHVDMIWPLWNLFDFTPEGRGSSWYPKLAYGS